MSVDDIVKAVQNLPTDKGELDALIGDIRAAYEDIVEQAGDNPTEEQVEQIEALSDAMTKARAARADADDDDEAEGADEAASQDDRNARAAAAAEAFAADAEGAAEGAAEPDDSEADAEDAGEYAAATVVEEETATETAEEPASGADAADVDNSTDDAVEEPEGAEEAADDADDDAEDQDDADDDDAADNDNSEEQSVSRYAGRTKGVQPTPKKTVTPFALDASAPNYRGGDDITLRDLAEAFNAASSGRAIRSNSQGGSTTAQFGHIKRNLPDRLVANDEVSMQEAVEFATNEANLDGGSLVAAAGWCAPSETIYTFLPTTPATGLFSLPEIGINRGGLRFPVEPDFSALYDASKYHMTEAEAISGRTKECIEIPCADMDEVRMDVLWTCITSNLLANKGWPELTAKFLAEATKGHLHRLSAARLAAVRAQSDDASIGIPEVGTIGTILNALELQAQDIRLKYRLGDNATVEGVAPAWFKTILRADLAYRDGVLPQQVTDQNLEQHLTDRGVRFQYVDDYQTDIIGAGPDGLAYPEAVEVVLYPAGTFFSAVENVINLGVTYDSTGLSRNQRTEMFLEDGYAVGKRAYESRKLTLPINVNGHVGTRVEPTAPTAGGDDGQGEG